MPQRRSLKYAIVESLVFLGLFASLGHMTANFWEKFMIESELVHLKTSLHSLKETITQIGVAYDNLHKELRNLIEVAEKYHPAKLNNVEDHIRPAQPSLPASITETDPSVAEHDKTTENKNPARNEELEETLNTDPLDAATITRNSLIPVGVGYTNMYSIENESGDFHKPQNENGKPDALVNTKTLNACTITGNPLESIGDGNTNKDPIEYKRENSVNEPHDCIYAPGYKYCRRRNQYNNPYYNWRV